MLHQGQDPDSRDYDNRTPLMLACAHLLLRSWCVASTKRLASGS